MSPFSAETIGILQGMTAEMFVDEIEVNPLIESQDGYGNDIETYPGTGNKPLGSLQEVQRIPGTPEIGATTTVVGEFVIKLPAGTMPFPLPKKCRFIVNGRGQYEAMNDYVDRSDRLADTIYCTRIT